MTYAVVVFAVVVQGLSFAPLAHALGELKESGGDPAAA